MIGPFGPFVIVSCELTSDPKSVRLSAPGGIFIDLPYDTYETLRATLGLPELVCP